MSYRHADTSKHTKFLDALGKKLTRPCVAGAIGRCRKCSCTLKTRLDLMLHRCEKRKKTEQIYEEQTTIGRLRAL